MRNYWSFSVKKKEKKLTTEANEGEKERGKKKEREKKTLSLSPTSTSTLSFPSRLPPSRPISSLLLAAHHQTLAHRRADSPSQPRRRRGQRRRRQPDAQPPVGAMELVPVKPADGALVEVGSGSVDGTGSIPAMVAAQQELLHEQVGQLQRLVVAQCRLTGVNPLAQEMVSNSHLQSLPCLIELLPLHDVSWAISSEVACDLLRGYICD